jgi:hypothetical protein
VKLPEPIQTIVGTPSTIRHITPASSDLAR